MGGGGVDTTLGRNQTTNGQSGHFFGMLGIYRKDIMTQISSVVVLIYYNNNYDTL